MNPGAERGQPQLVGGLVHGCQACKHPAGVLITCLSVLGLRQIWRILTVGTEHHMLESRQRRQYHPLDASSDGQLWPPTGISVSWQLRTILTN